MGFWTDHMLIDAGIFPEDHMRIGTISECQRYDEREASMYTLCQMTDEEKEQVAIRGYNILRVLSHGSCSIVYLSEFKKVKNKKKEDSDVTEEIPLKLVCKVMETVRAPKDFVQKFLPRELANLSRIRGANMPHIIHVHSILQYKSKVMVFMRHAELGNLCDYIRSHKDKLTEKMAKYWFRQLAVALAFLHTMEIAHRDIKCENVLLTANYNVKLCDFGFSRLSVDAKGKPVFSTTYCGSMGYAAPELLKGVPYNPKVTDVWSLGIVLFVLLNSSMPFKADNPMQLYTAQINKDYRFRQSILNQVSKQSIELVDQMLEPSWQQRLTSEGLLASKWLIDESALTTREMSAMVFAGETKKDMMKPITKIIDSNRETERLETIEEADSLPASDVTVNFEEA